MLSKIILLREIIYYKPYYFRTWLILIFQVEVGKMSITACSVLHVSLENFIIGHIVL